MLYKKAARSNDVCAKTTAKQRLDGFNLVSIQSTDYWREMEKNRVGNMLAGARLKARLTQSQLAHELGIRQNMVSDYENGRRTYSDAMARRLSAVLKVKEERLKYGSEPER